MDLPPQKPQPTSFDVGDIARELLELSQAMDEPQRVAVEVIVARLALVQRDVAELEVM